MGVSDALEIVGITDPGRVRAHNEDFFAERGDIGLVVLADGMGGYNAGEVASGMAARMVTEGLGRAWRAAEPDKRDPALSRELAKRLIAEQLERANWAIYEKAQAEPQCAGMGTTIVVGLFFDDHLTLGHIGDSRVYRLRGEALEQVTKDHSLLQEQIDSGMVTQEEARLSRNKNLLTRALGVDPQVEPAIQNYRVEAEDVYLVCSDGLSDMVNDEEIRLTLITLRSDMNLAAKQLIQSANDSGGRDNISVILVRVVKAYAARRGWYARIVSWLTR